MRFTFNQFTLDSDLFELSINGQSLPAEPQVIELIALLINNRHRMVSREEMFGTIWAGKVISETTLNSRIKMARKVLGDNGQAQTTIKTIRGKGFRFVAALDNDKEAVVDKPIETTVNLKATLRYEKPGIAVLAFKNLSGNSDQDYLSDGIAEEILTSLAAIPDLLVIARNSSFAYKNQALNVNKIGQELGVDYLLEGSMRRSSNRIRITAQLIETKSGGHLWAERYDRNMQDIFSVQDEIAREVCIALQTRIGFDASLVNFQSGTTNHDAWMLCIRGIEKYNLQSRMDNAKARQLLEQAVAIDPNYIGALSMLGWANYSCIRHDLSNDVSAALTRLKEMIENLFNRDANHPDAYFLSAGLKLLQFDYTAAIDLALIAVELKPNDPNTHAYLAQLYSCTGQAREAIQRINFARRISPHYATWMLVPLIDIHCQLGSYEEALKFAQLAVERAPDSLQYRARLAALLGILNYSNDANLEVSRLFELDPNFSTIQFKSSQKHVDPDHLEQLSRSLVKLGVPQDKKR